MDLKQLAWLIATGQATAADLAGADPSFVRDAKCGAAGFEIQVRAAACTVMRAAPPADGEPAGKKITYIASTEDQDRMGDIIRVYGRGSAKGWQLANFKANPVGLWCHESWAPPIASVKAWRVKEIAQNGVLKPALMSEFDYHTEENPAADVAHKLALKGALRAVSVGFRPLEWATYNSVEEREAAGLGPYGMEFLASDLHEVSNCAVPANPFALVVGLKSLVEAGAISDREARVFHKIYPLTDDELVTRLRDRIRSVVDFGRHLAPIAPPPVDEPDEPPQPVKATAPAAPAAPAPDQVELRIVVRGTAALDEAVAHLLAAGPAAFRSGSLVAAEGTGAPYWAYTADADADPDGEGAPIDGKALRAAMPAAARTAVLRALSAVCDQLGEALEAVSVVTDAIECDLPTEDLDALALSAQPLAAPDAHVLLRGLTDLLAKRSIHQPGGPGGAPAPNTAGPRAEPAADDFEPAQARDLVSRVKALAAPAK